MFQSWVVGFSVKNNKNVNVYNKYFHKKNVFYTNFSISHKNVKKFSKNLLSNYFNPPYLSWQRCSLKQHIFSTITPADHQSIKLKSKYSPLRNASEFQSSRWPTFHIPILNWNKNTTSINQPIELRHWKQPSSPQ